MIASKSHEDKISTMKNKIDNFNSNNSFNGLPGQSEKENFDKRQKKKLE